MMEVTRENALKAMRKAFDAGDMVAARRMAELANRLGAPAKDDRQAMRDRVAAAKAGALTVSPDSAARAAEMDQIAADEMTIAADPMRAGMSKFLQGVPFAGQWLDEGMGALQGPQAMEQTRAMQAAMDRQRPGLSTALQLGGGVAGGLAALPLAAPVAGAAPVSMAGQAAFGFGTGAALGAAEGAVSGAGAANGGDRASGAATGAMVGGALGGVLGAATPVVASGISWIAQNLKGRDYRQISKALGIDRQAAKVVANALRFDDLATAEQALRRAGKDAMLADAGQGLAGQLDIAMSATPEAAAIGRKAVDSRVARSYQRLTAALDATLGKPEGTRAIGKSIASRTAAQRAAAYDRAYASAIDYAGNAGRAIEGVLSRVPRDTLSRAIKEANEAMQARGARNLQIMAQVGEDGSVAFREMPNVEQLDEIKKALQAIAQSETDAVTGKISSAGRRANMLASDLRTAISDAVPDYDAAVKLGGDKIAEENAANLGRKLLSPSTTRETVREVFGATPSKEERLAALRGLRSQIDETLAQVQAAFSDPNTDIREAAKLVKSMSSRANKEKVAMVLGRSRAEVLFRALDQASAFFETRSMVAANSRTAARQAGQRAMDQITAPGPLGELAQGRPVAAAQSVVRAATGMTPEAMQLVRDKNYVQIARALTSIRGPEAENALRFVRQAIEGQPLKTEQANAIARVLSASGALTAYQAGTQYQLRSGNALAPR